MSRGARWTLGCFALFFAGCFIFSEQNAPSKSPVLVYVLAGFCGLIAVACFSKGWRTPAVRLIGAITFIATVAYLVWELVTEPTKSYSGRSEPHWLNAIKALIIFGLPGAYVAIRGIYPTWGKASAVFRPEVDGSPHDDVEPYDEGDKYDYQRYEK